jgi:coenzyme F420-reducing hydrogenase alpha subunit
VDVKQYYRKLREIEATLNEQYVLVVSLETPDGGKAGRVSEVSREVAAKMMLEGRAVLASEKEREAYLQEQTAAKKAARKAELARRVQVAIIADPDAEGTRLGKQDSESDTGK